MSIPDAPPVLPSIIQFTFRLNLTAKSIARSGLRVNELTANPSISESFRLESSSAVEIASANKSKRESVSDGLRMYLVWPQPLITIVSSLSLDNVTCFLRVPSSGLDSAIAQNYFANLSSLGQRELSDKFNEARQGVPWQKLCALIQYLDL